MKQVYLDYSATTPVKKEVLQEMLPFFSEGFGNPSSLYSPGQASKEAIATARMRLASLIGASEREVFFTSSGTEADNWAILGACDAQSKKGKHVITTKIEHHAVLHSCEFLEKHGYRVTYLEVGPDGVVGLKALEDAITDETVLVSIMLINNEIGTMQPVKELCAAAHERGILFHTDAVQALGNVPIDVKDLGIDLMSVSAHKIYGPKGVGALYMKKGTRISNYMHGGAQEGKKRAGTENLAGIVGFGKAAALAEGNLGEHIKRVTELREYLIDQVLSEIPDVFLNGNRKLRHPGNANFTFKYIEGEAALLLLDTKGIFVSTGSACSSESLEPSHVLSALNIPAEFIHGSLRLTIGDFTTKEDIDYVVGELAAIVVRLREISSVSNEKGW
ncbi:MAG: cysteine desulfurase NifS [Clostridiales bacterium]|nr:cysteine desulfurase NifS [Clostridiales bacterium]